MKILLDSCVWGGARQAFTEAGHDAIWSGDWPEDPGDEAILARAYQEQRILVTLDKDFGELAIIKKKPHYGILRLVNLASRQQVTVCLRVLDLYGAELLNGAIVTAEYERIRIRPADPLDPETNP